MHFTCTTHNFNNYVAIVTHDLNKFSSFLNMVQIQPHADSTTSEWLYYEYPVAICHAWWSDFAVVKNAFNRQ